MGDRDHARYHRSIAERNTHFHSPSFEAKRKAALGDGGMAGHRQMDPAGDRLSVPEQRHHRPELLARLRAGARLDEARRELETIARQPVADLRTSASADRTAATIARAVFGYCWTNAAVQPSTFSGWSCQMSWVVVTVKPMRSAIARAPQGSPTQ